MRASKFRVGQRVYVNAKKDFWMDACARPIIDRICIVKQLLKNGLYLVHPEDDPSTVRHVAQYNMEEVLDRPPLRPAFEFVD